LCSLNWCRFFPWPCTCKLLRVWICRQVMTSSQEQDHCATSGDVRCVCWCGKFCDHDGGITNKRKKWKKQCKLKKEPRRDEKFCLAGFCAKKKQNKMKDLLYFRYDIYTYVITARISGTTCLLLSRLIFQVMFTYVITSRISGTTCLRMLSHLVFQVRHVQVCYHISYIWHMFTYVITSRISGTTCSRISSQLVCQVRHVHVCFHSLNFRYGIYTT
jgi:hypothetical protein